MLLLPDVEALEALHAAAQSLRAGEATGWRLCPLCAGPGGYPRVVSSGLGRRALRRRRACIFRGVLRNLESAGASSSAEAREFGHAVGATPLQGAGGACFLMWCWGKLMPGRRSAFYDLPRIHERICWFVDVSPGLLLQPTRSAGAHVLCAGHIARSPAQLCEAN